LTALRLVVVALVILLSASTGCGGKAPVKPSEQSDKAAKAVQRLADMEKAYESRKMDDIVSGVSQDYKNGYAELLASLRKDSEMFSKVSVDIKIDRVEETKDDTRVVTHWTGTWTTKDGRTPEGRGEAVFVFANSEKAPLVDVIGDMPFSMVK